ncbi:MATE family efflux transporter [Paludibaculum fermentans]|uniref:Multidrug-efflux transporter n=1 Tax=Paludibaculum fermentans TaxID=1473598 RepID=A0A7S7SJ12_PALFE|nr:MATE family efflux transporter [Paludibaculum fermentans]QOY86031.1 MATE family efflux transporter [Paludibaculum fermentans]
MAQGSNSLWRDIRDAVAGAERDYTSEPLSRAILLLAVPMVLEMCMESLFGIVNIFWVARLGEHAVAGVGLTETMLTVLYAVAMGVGMATTAMVARRTGEKDPDGAAVAAVQAIILGLFLSLLTAVPGILYSSNLLRLIGGEPIVVESTHRYTAIMLGSSPSIMLLFLMNAIFRGAGDAAIAMRVLWAANLLNMVLDPCLIYGLGPFPELGITGASVATSISRSFGVVLQLIVLFRGRGRVAVTWAQVRVDFAILRRLSRISATGMLQFLIAHASWVGLVTVIAKSGSAALAGYTIAIRVIVFTLLPSWGLANAAATLVGQNLGAREPDRAEQAVWRTGLYNMCFLGLVGLACILFPEPMIRFFSTEPDVVRYGAQCLRIISYGYVFYAYGMVMVQALNGAGDTVTPTIVNLACYWMFQIPLAWFLAIHLQFGAVGAFWAVPAAESVLAVVGVMVFRRGRWKKQAI